MAFLSATNVGPYSVLARKPSAHPAGKHPQKGSLKRETVSRESEGPAPSRPTTGGREVCPSGAEGRSFARVPWRPSLPAPVLPRLTIRREMGTPETPSRVYTWGGAIDINGVTRSRHQGKRSDGVSTRQKPHGTCTRGMDSSTIEPASRAQLPETPSCVYTR